MGIDRNTAVAIMSTFSVVVLLGISSILGFLGKDIAMGLAIVAGGIGLAFSNIDRIKRFKGGGFEAETWPTLGHQTETDVAVDISSKSAEFKLLENLDLHSKEGRRKAHSRLRAKNREVYLAHTLAPTKTKGMLYDAFIYIRPSVNNNLNHVEEATFFLGKGFGNKVIKGQKMDEYIGIGYSVYGEFFCTCLVKFKNGEEVMLERYIDFDMAEWVE